MDYNLPSEFRIAKIAAKHSKMHPQVGAALSRSKSFISGYNKDKTHTLYANPAIHVRTSIHAELDCINRSPYPEADELYVYREIEGKPAMARPCNHCMKFIKKAGVKRIYYTIPHEPYWESEEL